MIGFICAVGSGIGTVNLVFMFVAILFEALLRCPVAGQNALKEINTAIL